MLPCSSVSTPVALAACAASSFAASGRPPSQTIGGRPKKRGRQAPLGHCHPLRQPRQLAEGVEFPEKNADFRVLETSFGGGGRISREKCRFWVFEVIIWRRRPPNCG